MVVISHPLSAREIVESCVIPILLHGAKNWILDETSRNLLERFQAELGRKILKLSNHHSTLSTLIGLSWPTIKARLLSQKLHFLVKAIEIYNMVTRTFRTIASHNIPIVEQCIIYSPLGTKRPQQHCHMVEAAVKTQLKSIKNIS